jgi:hypothetical protein
LLAPFVAAVCVTPKRGEPHSKNQIRLLYPDGSLQKGVND